MDNEDDDVIPGLHVVEHTGRASQPRDPSKPFTLEVVMTPPGFMQVLFVLAYGGTERLVVQGDTLEAIETLIVRNELETHPRLTRLTITGPEGVVRTIDRRK